MHGVRRPFQPGLEFGDRLDARIRRFGAFDELQLQLQGGERRAQLVRGVGHEGALHGLGRLHAHQQVVQRGDQRLDFLRRGQPLHRGERLGRAHRERLCKTRERPQAAMHEPPDEQRKRGQQDQEGLQGAPRGGGGQSVAHAQRLGDRDRQPARLQGEAAPLAVLASDGGQPEAGELGRHQRPARRVDDEARAIPDADHVIEVFVVRQAFGGIEKGLVAQGERDLLQLVIEKVVRLLAGKTIGRPGAEQHGDADGADHAGQQVRTQGAHGSGLRGHAVADAAHVLDPLRTELAP